VENIYRHQSLKCPFCSNTVPFIPFGKGFVAICLTCDKIVYDSQKVMPIFYKEKRKETLDYSKTDPAGGG
jgi:hypothetical protein